jgi:hypothetical protein
MVFVSNNDTVADQTLSAAPSPAKLKDDFRVQLQLLNTAKDRCEKKATCF